MMPYLKDADRVSPFRDAGETRERVCDAVRGALHIKSTIGGSVTWDAFRPRRAERVAPFEARKKKTFLTLFFAVSCLTQKNAVTASSTSP